MNQLVALAVPAALASAAFAGAPDAGNGDGLRSGSMPTGCFKVVPDSGGAGNIV